MDPIAQHKALAPLLKCDQFTVIFASRSTPSDLGLRSRQRQRARIIRWVGISVDAVAVKFHVLASYSRRERERDRALVHYHFNLMLVLRYLHFQSLDETLKADLALLIR